MAEYRTLDEEGVRRALWVAGLSGIDLPIIWKIRGESELLDEFIVICRKPLYRRALKNLVLEEPNLWSIVPGLEPGTLEIRYKKSIEIR